MRVVAMEGKIKVLAERRGWSLDSARGFIQGEAFRRQRKTPPLDALVGLDDYSQGFRAGYFDRPLPPGPDRAP